MEKYRELFKLMDTPYKSKRIEFSKKFIMQGMDINVLKEYLFLNRNDNLEKCLIYICSETQNIKIGWEYLCCTITNNYLNFDMPFYKMSSYDKKLISDSCASFLKKEFIDIFITHMIDVNKFTVEKRKKYIEKLNEEYIANPPKTVEDTNFGTLGYKISDIKLGIQFGHSRDFKLKTDLYDPLTTEEIFLGSQCSMYYYDKSKLEDIRKDTVYLYVLKDIILNKITDYIDVMVCQEKIDRETLNEMIGYDWAFKERFLQNRLFLSLNDIQKNSQELEESYQNLKELIHTYDEEKYIFNAYTKSNRSLLRKVIHNNELIEVYTYIGTNFKTNSKNSFYHNAGIKEIRNKDTGETILIKVDYDGYEPIFTDYQHPIYTEANRFASVLKGEDLLSPFNFVSEFLYDYSDVSFIIKFLDDAYNMYKSNDVSLVINFLIYYLYENNKTGYNVKSSFITYCLYGINVDIYKLKECFNEYELLINDKNQRKLLTDIVSILIAKGDESAFIFFVQKMYNERFDIENIISYVYTALTKEKDYMFFETYLSRYLSLNVDKKQMITSLSVFLKVKSPKAIDFMISLIADNYVYAADVDFFKREIIYLIEQTQIIKEKKSIKLDLGIRWELICRKIVKENFSDSSILYHPVLENNKIPDIYLDDSKITIIECKLSQYFTNSHWSNEGGEYSLYDELDKYLDSCDRLEYWILNKGNSLDKIFVDSVNFYYYDDIKENYNIPKEIDDEVAYIKEVYYQTEITKKSMENMSVNTLVQLYISLNERLYKYVKNENISPKKLGSKRTSERFERKYVIRQFDLKGTFISEFDNVKNASKETEISVDNISNVIAGHRYSAGGFLWKRFDINSTMVDIEPPQKIDLTGKVVLQISLEGEVVSEFLTVSAAVKSSGINRKSISDVLKGKQKTAGGYYWMLKN